MRSAGESVFSATMARKAPLMRVRRVRVAGKAA
jgi:hypothetical protein